MCQGCCVRAGTEEDVLTTIAQIMYGEVCDVGEEPDDDDET